MRHLTLVGVALLAFGLAALGGDQPLLAPITGTGGDEVPDDQVTSSHLAGRGSSGHGAGGRIGADGDPAAAITVPRPDRAVGTPGQRGGMPPVTSTGPSRPVPPQPLPGRSPRDDAITPDPYARVPGGSSSAVDPRHDEHHDGPTSPEGFQVAGGTSEAGEGSEITYTVEVEPAVDVDISDLVVQVEDALHDPGSWARDHTLRRVDDPDAATIRVVLASPGTVDELCARAGLRTGGIFSCWNGRFAALNSWRWAEGASGFGDDLDDYRRYLVNHEFGHGLGYGHVGCPAVGEPAPIMMQQTKGTGGCEPNGWPYPELATDHGD